MRTICRASLLGALVVATVLGPAIAQPAGPRDVAAPSTACAMRQVFTATDTNVAGGRSPVWGADADPARGAVLFAAPLNVNTDGTRRSYSVDDPGGRSFALNNICNAMAGYCSGLGAAALQARFDQLRQARAQDWNAPLVAGTRLSASVIPRRPDGRVCPEVEAGGRRYLVSSTALFDRRIGDPCRIERYVDALTVPALVLQGGTNGFTRRDIRVGDAVVAWRPGLAGPVYAVAGDTGPNDRLGEGSIALNAALLGLTGEPTNYRQVRRDYVVPKAYVLIFPATRDAANPRITAERVSEAARAAFTAWGGGSEAGAMERMRACAGALDGRR